jgi:probable phosphoglycerate mutase
VRELLVVRHGESEGNVLSVVQGALPFPLTARGRAQARRVAAVMASLGWRPDHVVSSPLPRCLETARIVAEELGVPAPLPDEAFTEIGCGTATGRPLADLGPVRGFEDAGGESEAQLRARVGRGLDRLPRDASVLLVTHGAVFKGVLAHLLGLGTRFLLDLRHTTCMRLERRRVGGTELVAWTHLLHAEEWPG